jgi:uncharacterized MAPEG superfamily protein
MTFAVALLAIALLTFTLVLIEVSYVYMNLGFAYAWSSNRPVVERQPLGTRVQRTLANQVEACAYALPVLTVAAIVGLNSPAAETAALVHVVARATFVILYFTGIPLARVPAWGIGWLPIAYIGYVLVDSGVALG